nr:3'-5' exonuclease [Kineococcus vitellinus]
MQFAFIEDDAELRRAIEDSFAAWRIFLHPEQRKYATTRYNGPFRLSGGAGTGKTVVLLHRARHLARQNPHARILLTTYTRTLAEALRADLRRLDPTLKIAAGPGESGVYISGVDAAVSSVLKAAKNRADAIEAVLGARSPQTSGRTKESAWSDAAQGVELPPELLSRTFLASEYAMVVLPARATSRDEYLTVRRPGRGVSLDRKKRASVWSIVASYRAQASIEGSVDFAEAASIAAASLEATGPLFDHVLVDEGQDLTPSHWQFLRASAGEGSDDLFIAEDSHQRIYGQRVVLGRYNIKIVGRSQRLTLNYRTTAQNLGYAVAVLEGGEFHDLEDAGEDARGYRSARTGPRPRVIHVDSLSEEFDQAADVVRRWSDETEAQETIGLLVRDQQTARRLSIGLDERGVPVRIVEGGVSSSAQPLVMTMHRAKGMEFSRVLIFGVDEGSVPAEYAVQGLPDADCEDALLRERSLLYVAATRARDELVLLTRQPSPILPGIARKVPT